jgi:hypothetical protein
MKSLVLSGLVLTSTAIAAQPLLVPSNPPPVVQLAWNAPAIAPTGHPITAYFVYSGGATGAYTNKTPTGSSATNFNYTIPTRGVKYFIAVTALDSIGLESIFSNEITYTAGTPPGPPNQLPATVVVAQTAPTPTGPWTDQPELAFNLPPANSQEYIRLRIVAQQAPPPATGTSGPRPALAPPPIPGKL